MIDEGRKELDDPDSMSRSSAEWVAGSYMEMMLKRLGRQGPMAKELVPQLMYMAVRPYLGEEAAKEELAMPPPRHWEEMAVEPDPSTGLPPAPDPAEDQD
jgi:hypothetical protein